MGLDMYLDKCPRMTEEELDYAKKVLDDMPRPRKKSECKTAMKVLRNKCTNKLSPAVIERLKIHANGDKGFYWFALTKEVCYWRKVNAIHEWFVANAQNGVDDCEDHEVTEQHIRQLIAAINEVFKDRKKAQDILPTRPGSFFGSLDYDGYYYGELMRTKKILQKALKDIDFKQEMLIYRSSW